MSASRIFFKTNFIFAIAASATLVQPARAEVAPLPQSAVAEIVDLNQQLRDKLRIELSKKIASARVELMSAIKFTRGAMPQSIDSVSLINETSRGEAVFTVRGGEESAEGYVSFSAWVPARIALKRVSPGEKLAPENFITQDVNVAFGQPREYRGVILGAEIDLATLEARQTLLEGQMVLSTSVQKIPLVRRGDVVRLEVSSNGATLSTQGTAEEAGYAGSTVHVISVKTKRSIVGKLNADRTVEVSL